MSSTKSRASFYSNRVWKLMFGGGRRRRVGRSIQRLTKNKSVHPIPKSPLPHYSPDPTSTSRANPSRPITPHIPPPPSPPLHSARILSAAAPVECCSFPINSFQASCVLVTRRPRGRTEETNSKMNFSLSSGRHDDGVSSCFWMCGLYFWNTACCLCGSWRNKSSFGHSVQERLAQPLGFFIHFVGGGEIFGLGLINFLM